MIVILAIILVNVAVLLLVRRRLSHALVEG